ncbi:DUF4139 domain-containing protein [Aestuariibius sp. 2305UL40-4]|uniref:DUF4139 domain-containing protein n=1 Tax=Aestuariibius violaceus TaxID=3234132 RepID=UPI00345E946F
MTKTFLRTVSFIAMASAAYAQEAGPDVTRVDLGQSGIALYTLTQEDAGTDIALTVPRDHADDVLASLIIRDPSGRIVGITTATPASVPESLRGTPFAGGLPRGITAVLSSMTGAEIRVTTDREEVTGRVMGLSERSEVVGDTTITHPAVLLQQENGALTEVVLRPGVSIAIDEGIGNALTEAAESLTGDDTERTFDLTLETDDNAARDVELSYVTEAPAWKNSWRLLLDEGRLQGWATVENLSGQDWSDISLTLSTGTPVAYDRDLLSPLRIGRQTPPNLIAGRPTVRPDVGFVSPADRQRLLRDAPAGAVLRVSPSADMIAMEEAAPAALAPAAQSAQEIRGIGNVRYAVPEPVDLPAGQTANLLYIDLEIDPQIRALYQPGRSRDVLLAVALTADQPLAPGLVSVRDANGFVGDAPFTGLSADQTRFLPYAAAPNATVVQNRSEAGTRIDFAATDGALTVELRTQIETQYAATVPDGVEIFAVEHPKSGYRFIETNGEMEENETFLRISREVTEGTASVLVTEEQTIFRQYALDANGLRQALQVVTTGSAEVDEADEAILAEAREAVRAVTSAETSIADLDRSYDRLLQEQQRLRQNLHTVTNADLRRRYETRLSETEDEILETLDATDAARTDLRARQTDLGDIIRRFR